MSYSSKPENSPLVKIPHIVLQCLKFASPARTTNTVLSSIQVAGINFVSNAHSTFALHVTFLPM